MTRSGKRFAQEQRAESIREAERKAERKRQAQANETARLARLASMGFVIVPPALAAKRGAIISRAS